MANKKPHYSDKAFCRPRDSNRHGYAVPNSLIILKTFGKKRLQGYLCRPEKNRWIGSSVG